jgi:hypothetical protein
VDHAALHPDVVVVRRDDQHLVLQHRIAAGPEAADVLDVDQALLARQRARLLELEREGGTGLELLLLQPGRGEQRRLGIRQEVDRGRAARTLGLARLRLGLAAHRRRAALLLARELGSEALGVGLALVVGRGREDEAGDLLLPEVAAHAGQVLVAIEDQHPLALHLELLDVLLLRLAGDDERAAGRARVVEAEAREVVVLAEGQALAAELDVAALRVEALLLQLPGVEVAVLGAGLPAQALQARAQEARRDLQPLAGRVAARELVGGDEEEVRADLVRADRGQRRVERDLVAAGGRDRGQGEDERGEDGERLEHARHPMSGGTPGQGPHVRFVFAGYAGPRRECR